MAEPARRGAAKLAPSCQNPKIRRRFKTPRAPRQLLAETDLPVGYVAGLVGFSEASQRAACQRRHGLLPSEIRRARALPSQGPPLPEPLRAAVAAVARELRRTLRGLVEAENLPAFQLVAGESISGRVVDVLSRRPLAGAWLWLGRGSHHFQTTGRDGTFRWRPPAGRSFYAGAEGYLAVRVAEVSPPASQAAFRGPLEIALAPAMHLRGRVVDGAGEGIDGATIRGRFGRFPGNRPALQPLREAGHWTATQAEATSGAGGYFELRGLPPLLPCELKVARSGFASRTLTAPGGFRGETFTGTEGRFAVDDVPEGRCTVLVVDRPSGRSGRQEIEVLGATEIVLEILTGGDR